VSTTHPEHLRLFVAIQVPEAIRTVVARAQSRLRQATGRARVRWTPAEQFHLTLRFLGNVDCALIESLQRAMHNACAHFTKLQLRAERIGFFPDPQRPRVVWVGVSDRLEKLAELQKAIQIATQEFTSEPSEDRFSGHVTLGRIKEINRPDSRSLVQAASAMADEIFGEWDATGVELMKSQLGETGAKHLTLAQIPLAA
jgi:2'-5' RNA ligase